MLEKSTSNGCYMNTNCSDGFYAPQFDQDLSPVMAYRTRDRIRKERARFDQWSRLAAKRAKSFCPPFQEGRALSNSSVPFEEAGQFSSQYCHLPRDNAITWKDPVCLRRALGVPDQGVSSVAVVGSSGSLLHGRWGAQIDDNEVIVRMNDAPVAGFEEVVGRRSSVRLLNSQAMFRVLERCDASRGSCDPSPSCCPSEPGLVLNSAHLNLVRCFRRVCGRGLHMNIGVVKSHPLFRTVGRQIFSDSFLRGKRVSSGIYGLAIACMLRASVQRVRTHVYGISLAMEAPNETIGKHSRYHYYDSCHPVSSDMVGSLERAARQVSQAMRSFPLVTFHEVSGSAQEWTPTTREAVQRLSERCPRSRETIASLTSYKRMLDSK